MYEDLLGPLRGRMPPPEDVLRRLHELSSAFRITWTPATARRPARWWLHEVRPYQGPVDHYRREVGLNRLRRLGSLPAADQDSRMAEFWQAEDLKLGYYYVGDYAEGEFGSEGFFRELRRGHELILQEQRAQALQASREAEGTAEVAEEMAEDSAFRQHIRDVAMDFYNQVAGATTVGWTPATTGGTT